MLLIIALLPIYANIWYPSDDQYKWPRWASGLNAIFGRLAFIAALILLLMPSFLNVSKNIRPLMNSHFWHILEELTFSAFLFMPLVVAWHFTSRESNSIVTRGQIVMATIGVIAISYTLALPFFLLVERPIRNFLDLVLFPNKSIYVLKEEEEMDSEEEDEDDLDAGNTAIN